ncbi:MAG: TIGR03915 family putative DNA repair protein [Tyzzerella sp.]|nr:TIGR03915 family putative DNA repair protein [Tyzzerella sp.]
MKRVYVCNDTITGIFSGIYDAWKTKLGQEQLGIVLKGCIDQELFCEYAEVVESEKKTIAVENLIKKHMGYEAYWEIYHAVLSSDKEKGDAILGMMLEARNIPQSKKIMQHLSHPKVRKVFELSRNVSNEAHYYREIIRFRELDNGILFSQIEPKSQILTCLGDHFTDRFPLENWMIYDRTHKMFLVHPESKHWVLVLDEVVNEEAIKKVSVKEKTYEKLWKGFFESVAIEERKSYDRQRQHLPLHYRKHVTEFQ